MPVKLIGFLPALLWLPPSRSSRNNFMTTWLSRVLFTLLTALWLAAPAQARDLIIRDDLGRELALNAPAQRVVVLGEFAAELLVALQATDLVIGRAHWISWPEEVAEKPHLGLQAQPNLEVLLSWHADLILADAHYRHSLNMTEKLNIPLLVYQGRDMPSLRQAISQLGQALDRPQQSARLLGFVDEIELLLDEKLGRTEALPMVLAFSEKGPPYYDMLPLQRLFNNARIRSLDSAAGGMSAEWLAAHHPELTVLVLWHQGKTLADIYKHMMSRPELKGLKRLRLMDSQLGFNLQALAGLLYVAKWAHPEQMAEVEPLLYHQRLWSEFFHQPLSGEFVYP